jgi:hypothetical protein
MSFPPKLVTILCLVQFLFVAMGFLITRGCLKLYDRIVPGLLGAHAPAVPALARFVRADGLWCLLVPLIWGVVALSRSDVIQGIASIRPMQFIIGVVLSAVLGLVFSLGAMEAVHVSFSPM